MPRLDHYLLALLMSAVLAIPALAQNTRSPIGEKAMLDPQTLAPISHSVRRIGTPNQRKFFCEKDFAMIQGTPRCRQSVAQSGLILEGWKAGLWKRPLMLAW
jgi:hypothetical protein